MGIKPYYDEGDIKIYLGDCLRIMPHLEPVDLVLTDPPYPDYERYPWKYVDISKVIQHGIHAFIFWKGGNFPLKYSAMHIWSKANRNIGDKGEQYELIFELNGSNSGLVMRHAVIDSEMNATLNGDIFCNHPNQKPIRLIKRILRHNNGFVLDPFMGSGTTLVAAKELGRKAIGIEIEEKYCEIAVERLRQEVFKWRSP